MTTQCYVHEFTLPKRQLAVGDVHSLLRSHCKAYTFQLERGDATGYEHYQGRLSLFKKKRTTECAALFPESGIHVSPTSNNSLSGPAFYCMKADTRIEGPWTEKNYEEPRVPSNRLVRSGIMENPYPWQKELRERLEVEDDRIVHMIVDPSGNNGKSIFVEWLEYLGLTIEMPGFNSAEDFLQAAMCLPELKVYLVDLPRAMPKKHLNGLFTAIEKLKNGYMCDKRYSFKWKRLLHSPSICLFSNKKPKLKYLSMDRWRLWTITKDKRLVVYKCDHKKPKHGRVQEEDVDDSEQEDPEEVHSSNEEETSDAEVHERP
jgi:hypothetical protein